jgi:hypothetical protein
MGKRRPILVLALLAVAGFIAVRHFASGDPVTAAQPETPEVLKTKRPAGSTAAKLRDIRLPAFKVEDISVAEFVEYLRVRSIAYDENPGEFPGVDIRIMPPAKDFHEDIDRGLVLTENYRLREVALASMSLEEIIRYSFGGTKIRHAVRNEVLWIHGPADSYK